MGKTLTKLKENLFKNQKIYGFSFVALCLISFILIMYKVELSSNILPYASHQSSRDEVQIIHDFISGMEIRQRFQSYSDFDFISFNFADHDQRLKGKLGILIREVDSGETIIYEEMDMSSVWYGDPVKISFESVEGGKANTQYEITLVASETEEVSLGVFGYKEEENSAVINGEKSEYALSFGIHSNTSLYFNISKIILLISAITIFVVIVYTFKLKSSEENMFLILAIPFVWGMLLLWPGNDVYDQGRHQNTVYHYSNVLLGCGEQDGVTKLQMRKCDIVDKEELKVLNTPVNAQAQAYHYYVNKMWDTASEKDMIIVDISDNPLVTDGLCIQYIPGIIGMTLARLLGCNYFCMLTITRLAIIGFYLIMCYYAIYKIPVLKMMVAFIAALPMNLYQASGISYDSFTFAVGIVVFAFIIKLWYFGLEKKDWLSLGIFVFLLGNCKGGVYLSLIVLMLFIPKEKYVRKKWLKIVGTLAIAGVSMMAAFLPTIISWFNLSVARHEGTEEATVVINSGGMMAQKLSPMFAVSNPIEFVRMFVQTLVERLDIYLGQMLGYRTAWSAQAISLVILFPFLVLLILSVIEKEPKKLEIGFCGKIGILGILLVELIGMQIIFLGETPMYSKTIVGFQGRYFILFLPCILLLFRNDGLVFKGKKEHLYIGYSMAQLVYWYFFLRMFMLY